MIETHSWWARQRRERVPKRERFRELSNLLKSRRLAVQQIIDAGYRAMAMKHHPDHGGSIEDMQRLNEARQELRRMVGM